MGDVAAAVRLIRAEFAVGGVRLPGLTEYTVTLSDGTRVVGRGRRWSGPTIHVNGRRRRDLEGPWWRRG